MPNYEYRCEACSHIIRLFYTYKEYDSAEPTCPYCGSSELRRLISQVALAKSEESRLDSLDPESMLAGMDEDDPRSIGRYMRKMSREMGEDLGDEFNEVVDRLESGESPESIEKSMPDLGDSSSSPFGGPEY